jgi:hypothetical protein
MRLLATIKRHLVGDFDALLLDHAPVSNERYDAHVARYKLYQAAKRYGRPFKCAIDGLPRERFVGSKLEVVGQTEAQPKPTAGVRVLKRAK